MADPRAVGSCYKFGGQYALRYQEIPVFTRKIEAGDDCLSKFLIIRAAEGSYKDWLCRSVRKY